LQINLGAQHVADQDISMFQKIWTLGNYHKLGAEHQIISEHLVAEAQVRAGQKILDLAAGTGNTALAAARRRARVTASDIVPEMLEVARRRIEAEQLEGVEFHVGNSSPTIPFPDAAFDTVLSSLGASFFPDHQRVVDELLRITRPGGTIGMALWPEASLPSDIFRAGQKVNEGATAIDKIQPAYQLCNGDYLREKLKGRHASVRHVSGTFESCFLSLDDYVEAHCQYHPPAILRLSAYTHEQREEYRHMLRRMAQGYNRATDGTIAVCMDYLILIIIKAS
jgi:ubiquinone/menaquinone biosynthesis C-methylase UbiE